MQHRIDALNAASIKITCALDYGNKIYDNPLDPGGIPETHFATYSI